MGKRLVRTAAVLFLLLLVEAGAGQDFKRGTAEEYGEVDSSVKPGGSEEPGQEDEILLQEEPEQEGGEIGESTGGIEQYYGTYRIMEFWPTIYYGATKFDRLPEQEADMLLGRIVEINEDLLVSWDCFIGLGTRTGRLAFIGNHMVERISIEAPQYEWEALDPDTKWYEKGEYYLLRDCGIREEYYEAIEGKIRIQIPDTGGCWQDYFVMENGVIMYSLMHHQFFYLVRVDMDPIETTKEEYLTEEEKQRILQSIYSVYTIVKFLPTKFYPACDSGGDILLPQEEADMMIGRKIVIGEDLFVTYDNLRLPNSKYVAEFMGHAVDEIRLEAIEIPAPDYQIQEKLRDDIFGLRDEMLPEEMVQEKYIEISVYPGYGIMDRTLPQLYMLHDGRMIMYAMGEYFLIEREG